MALSRSRSITPLPNEGEDGWENPFSQAIHEAGEKRALEGPPFCRAGKGRFRKKKSRKKGLFAIKKGVFEKQNVEQVKQK